jgi:hypothetical protein
MTGVSKVNVGDSRAVADKAPEVFMCEAVKSGWSKQNVIDAEFISSELDSRWSWEAVKASAVVMSLFLIGR